MRFLLAILLFFSLSGYSQHFLRDAQGRIITTESGGVLAIMNADTASSQLVLPPDTFQVFNITMVNPGDVSTPPLVEGIQAYWSLEETSGSTAYDSAASYDGTLMNTPTQSETGISNLCYSFDYSSSEWIDFGTSFYDVGTNDLTAAFWMKYTYDAGSIGGIMGNYGSTPYWFVRISGGGICEGRVDFGGGAISTYGNDLGAFTPGVWYHIVYQLDRDGTTKLYVNNVLSTDQDNISGSSAVNLSNSNTFAVGRIGNHVASWYHNGLIDEVNVYNRLLPEVEISNLYNVGVGKFWPYGVVGGDTLNMTIEGEDTRADTSWIMWKYTGWATDTTDGNIQFRIPIDQMDNYRDSNFLWTGRGDTTVYFTALTKDGTAVTEKGNQDTVFIDSSDIIPPIQDPGGYWDTLYHMDFEDHSTPIEYTSGQGNSPAPNIFSPDWNGTTWRNSDHAWPTWWAENRIPDSIVLDPITNSKVIKFSIIDDEEQGYCSDNSFRGGDNWLTYLEDPEPKEMYFSYNVMFMPNFEFGRGGKIPGISGGTYFVEGSGSPGYGNGFNANVVFYHTPQGSISWYHYYQNQTTSQYGEVRIWEEFTPEGENMNYAPGPHGKDCFIFDVTDYIWYNITIRVACNTFSGSTPNYDGILEGYVNGKLMDRWSGLYLLTYPDINEGVRMFVRAFTGGGWCPSQDQWILIDDFICFTYDEEVDVPRGNELSPPGRVLNLPNWPKTE